MRPLEPLPNALIKINYLDQYVDNVMIIMIAWTKLGSYGKQPHMQYIHCHDIVHSISIE